MKFFVSTGEASGDLHLSYLVKSVKSRYKDVDFVGVAGEKSKKEGVEILQDISELAIMGFTEAIKKYKFLKQKAYEYLQYIKANEMKLAFNRKYALDEVRLLEFIEKSQPRVFKELSLDIESKKESFFKQLDLCIRKDGIISVLKNGINHYPATSTISLLYHALDGNRESSYKEFEQNIFSVTNQLTFSERNKGLELDIAIFINGLPIITMELKSRASSTGWTYKDAEEQYKNDRKPIEPLFSFKRCMAHFAVDENFITFTTKLDDKNTVFMPFNKGTESGGSGNPINPSGTMTDYLWKDFLDKKVIKTHVYPGDIKLYIRLEISNGEDNVLLEIKHTHTNVTRILKNGKVLLSQICNDGDFNSSLTDRKILTVKYICDLAKTIDINLIRPIFEKVINYNSAIAEEGLKGKYGVNIGKMILDNIERGIYGNDIRNKAASYASAGSDARMSGCGLPVMTTSGSGNQGMTASLPIIKFAAEKNLSEEELIRGLFVSHLITIHVKTNVGRLSAYCGAICAASGVAAALTFLYGGSYEMVCDAITNILGNLSGVICDGAKASCAMKISSGIYSAFDAAILALHKDVLKSGDGIVGVDIEETIRNVGELAQSGMKGTDETILGIMTK